VADAGLRWCGGRRYRSHGGYDAREQKRDPDQQRSSTIAEEKPQAALALVQSVGEVIVNGLLQIRSVSGRHWQADDQPQPPMLGKFIDRIDDVSSSRSRSWNGEGSNELNSCCGCRA
jgi:hypothetical protein